MHPKAGLFLLPGVISLATLIHVEILEDSDRRTQAAALLDEAAEIHRILARRQLAIEDNLAFCEYVDEAFVGADHLRLIASKLHEVERYVETGGKEGIGRLIITVPPRHGKTQLVSKRWPARLLGVHPAWRLALVSYGGDLAEDASRAVRALIRDEPLYKQLWPNAALSDESQAVNRWALAGGSADNPNVVAVGVGGPLTGRGFQIIVIDDPIKGRQEAESQTVRESLKAWYKGTLRTRLEPGGAIVIIQTRWHEDDLVGWLLSQEAQGEGEAWELVNLPALAETKDPEGKKIKDPLGRKAGQALWPARYDRATLLATKRALGSYDWEAQYQGHPKPPGGAKIQREWLKVIEPEKVPAGMRWMRYWDLAISTKQGASYTAAARVAFDAEGNLYIAAMVRGRWEWPKQKKVLKATMLAEKPLGVMHGVETALHGTAVVQEFRTDPDLQGLGLARVTVDADKLTRALPWIALAEDGKVFLVSGAWVGDFIDEAMAFTGHNDKYDDQIDTVSGGVRLQSSYGGQMETSANPFY